MHSALPLGARVTKGLSALVAAALSIGVLAATAPPATAAASSQPPTFSRFDGAPLGGESLKPVPADLNEDGNLDVVSGLQTEGFAVELGNGDGTLAAPSLTTVSGASYGVSVADTNGDHHLDVIVNTYTQLLTYLGVGDGTFTAGAVLNVTGSSYLANEAGDYNGDGFIDVAVPETNGPVAFYQGAGDGTFTLAGRTATGASYSYASIAADFNKDGKADLVVPDFSSPNLTVLLSGPTDWTFTALTYPQMQGLDAEVIDTDGDGDLDIVHSGQALGVLHYDPTTATFTNTDAANDYSTNGVTAGDFNLDGIVDLAAHRQDFEWVYVGDDAGSYTGSDTGIGSRQYGQTRGDFNNDSFTDIVIANFGNYTEILTNTSCRTLCVRNQPADQTVTSGDTTTFTATAGPENYTTQWQVSVDSGDTFTDITDATASDLTLTPTTAESGNQYRAVMSSTDSAAVATSHAATLTVDPTSPTGVAQSDTWAVTAGDTATFNVTVDGDPTPDVQWQVSTDGANTFTDIADATGTSYAFPTTYADDGKVFMAHLTSTGGEADSNSIWLTVYKRAANVTTQPTNQLVNPGDPVTFTAAADGDPTPTVQWQVSTDDGDTFTDIAGESSTDLSFAADYPMTGNLYQAVFTNDAGAPTATTNPASLTVSPIPPTVVTHPEDKTVTAGDSVTFSASAEGTPTPTVQWQVSSDDGDTFTDITDAASTDLTFTAQPTDDGNLYQAVFTNPGGTDTTFPARLLVQTVPVVNNQPADASVVDGSPASFSAAAAGNPSPDVQWQVSTDGVLFTDIDGATDPTYTTDAVSPAQDGDLYRAVFTNEVGSDTSDSARLTVLPAPVTPSAPMNVTATQTGPGQITVTWDAPADAGSSPVTSYNVGWGTGEMGDGVTVGPLERSAVFNTMSDGAYTTSVAATSDAGTGDDSTAPVLVTTAAAPAAPASSPTASPSASPSASASVWPSASGSPVTRSTLTLTASPSLIPAGSTATLVATGAANQLYELRCYTRPSTTYVTSRTGSFDADGTPVTFTLSLGRNTRCFIQYAMSSGQGASPSVVVSVRTVLSLSATRTDTRTYTFQGRNLPRIAGQLITLYRIDADGNEIRSSNLRTDDSGIYRVSRLFTGSGTFKFRVRTPQTLNNAAGVSNTITVTVH
jgi:hypothetical protein